MCLLLQKTGACPLAQSIWGVLTKVPGQCIVLCKPCMLPLIPHTSVQPAKISCQLLKVQLCALHLLHSSVQKLSSLNHQYLLGFLECLFTPKFRGPSESVVQQLIRCTGHVRCCHSTRESKPHAFSSRIHSASSQCQALAGCID